ncbi:hypothetical protein OAL67_00075 [bacterium]|nr:hypothetical protein [bacterium]
MKRVTLIVFFSLFVIIPLSYFLFVYKEGYSDPNVRGAKTNEVIPTNGFSLQVTSKGGTWELYEYFCKTKEECLTSLMSGERFGNVGGGAVEDYDVFLTPDDSWEEYKFVKVFIRAGWGSTDRSFNLVGAEVLQVDYEGSTYNVLLVPVEDVLDRYYIAGKFIDS